MNNATIFCVCVWRYVFISLGYTLRTGISGSFSQTLCLTVCRPSGLFYKAASPFYIPIRIVWGFYNFSTSLATLVIVYVLFYYGLPRACEVLSHGFDLHLMNAMEQLFTRLLVICVPFLENCLFTFLLIFKLGCLFIIEKFVLEEFFILIF